MLRRAATRNLGSSSRCMSRTFFLFLGGVRMGWDLFAEEQLCTLVTLSLCRWCPHHLTFYRDINLSRAPGPHTHSTFGGAVTFYLDGSYDWWCVHPLITAPPSIITPSQLLQLHLHHKSPSIFFAQNAEEVEKNKHQLFTEKIQTNMSCWVQIKRWNPTHD